MADMEEELSVVQFRTLAATDVDTSSQTNPLLRSDDEVDDNNNEFNEDSTGNCNLIVNYLPHDIDDGALRVSCCEW